MKLRWFKRFLHLVLPGAVLGAALFSDFLVSGSARQPALQNITAEAQAACRDPATQWIVAICLGIYLVAFLILERRIDRHPQGGQSDNFNLWLGALAGLAVTHYALAYLRSSSSTQLLVLLVGITLGKGARLWVYRLGDEKAIEHRTALMCGMFVVLLAGAACCRIEMFQDFRYLGLTRWSGLWDNPNIYGMLMGVGLTLAIGLSAFVSMFKLHSQSQTSDNSSQKLKPLQWLRMALLLVGLGLLAIGLVKSYSRGAWLGALCGLGYLAWNWRHISEWGDFIRRHCFCLAVMLCGLTILAFWQFRQTEWVVARRAFSVGNLNDFSWRNRVSAWEGTLQMIADKPWLGFGWNQPEPIYDQYYRARRVVEGTAIQMNDYFMLGTTLGLPALTCFAAYLWLSLTRKGGRQKSLAQADGVQNSEFGIRNSDLTKPELLKVTCRAAAIVLLVGFWFDGGLFKLATAASFWILLELGREEVTADGHGFTRIEIRKLPRAV